MSSPEDALKEIKEKCNLLLELSELTDDDVYNINWWLGKDLTLVQIGFLDREWLKKKARDYLSDWAPPNKPEPRSFTLSTYRKLFGAYP